MTAPLLILGANGQVGRELAALAAAHGIAHRALGRAECDITDAQAVGRAITRARFVTNCAGYTAVDRAESEPDEAEHINARAPGVIAAACADAGVPLVHISTDYVFEGSGSRPWREDDPAAPQNVYGRTKLHGEAAVRARHAQHLILRTSWVFAAHGHNFVKTMLRLGAERSELRIVGDQRGGPTAAADIAAAILRMIKASEQPGFDAWGTYHFSGAPAVSWYEFACAILGEHQGLRIVEIASRDFPTPAKRPSNSVLDCSRIRSVFGIAQPDWRKSLRDVLDALAPRGDAAAKSTAEAMPG